MNDSVGLELRLRGRGSLGDLCRGFSVPLLVIVTNQDTVSQPV